MKKLVIIFFIGLIYINSASGNVTPDQLVQQTTDKVLAELTDNREALTNDQARLYQLVDEIVLPHFDFPRMSRFVLGKHWKKATDQQQEQFVDEFKNLLVRTYATALFEYTGQEIHYKPFRLKEGESRAVVKTEIKPKDGPAIPIDYALSLGEDSAWRVYDIRIDGLSLVTNYRSVYGRIIQTKGMEHLITSLAEKNQQLAQQ